MQSRGPALRANQHKERLGTVLLPVPFTQNLVSIVVCSFIEVKGRFA
jgi:hypothetical protein